MRVTVGRFVVVAALGACHSPAPDSAPDATELQPDAAPVVDTSPLVVDSLGVQGFVLRRGGDTVMTAPLFTRQSAFEVGLNVPLDADTAAIDAGISGVDLAQVRAIVSGHAHYDHFMDVPHLLERMPGVPAYTNWSMRW